jgi:hypothetical protein
MAVFFCGKGIDGCLIPPLIEVFHLCCELVSQDYISDRNNESKFEWDSDIDGDSAVSLHVAGSSVGALGMLMLLVHPPW